VGEAERAFEACWWVVDDLVRFGMTDACISPGSRSTPLALALARHPSIRIHVHLDERSAGFFALGLAKATSRPVAVACTSGTAAAELFPAVIEASMSRVSLVALTADRPPELRGVGANQTIDQLGLYGRYVRASIDAPVPGDRSERGWWHELVHDLTRSSMGPPPGPVHLNLPFREPLVPAPAELPASPPTDVEYSISEMTTPEELEEVGRALGACERAVVLAGGMREVPPDLPALAERLGWPLLAEPTSGLRAPGSLSAWPLLLADGRFVASHVPELVLQFGAAPTSRAALELVRRAERLIVVDQDHLVADPLRKAEWTIRADAAAFTSSLLERIGSRSRSSWLAGWREPDGRARAAVDDLLDSWEEPFEGRVARDLVQSIPEGSTLVVGSSLPIRDLGAYMRPRDGLGVVANRGTSGIDGFVATALGVAAAGRPTYALMGDLTFLYDAGTLLWSARQGFDAVLVIINNGGGHIFSLLEQRMLPELHELFTTPHRADIGAVTRAAGAGHQRVEAASDLVPAIEAARAAGGVNVVEVVVDPERDRVLRAEVEATVADALA
jgi:2-succinyl-5-enolpyruvyl-6-hydroxy-3-cyclohexene-1-carboxylate synthase